MESLSRNEVEARIAKALQSMSGDEIADLYNREFGDGLQYLGDDEFEQAGSDETGDEN